MSDWTPTARTTVASGADAIRYSNSAVFPIPASPRSTSDRLSPRRIAETKSSSSAHSLCPTSQAPTRAGGTALGRHRRSRRCPRATTMTASAIVPGAAKSSPAA